MIEALRRGLAAAGSEARGAMLVAASGGADSCALIDLLLLAGVGPLLIWHLDHGLRVDAAADAALLAGRVRRYRAAGHVVELLVEQVEIATLARLRGCGLEQCGRDERYRRLGALASARGLRRVCTAHHRDDQAETVLANILRGCGPDGLAGMAPARPLVEGVDLLRPLLACGRDSLRAHLHRRALDWREDASNRDPTFARNRLRHCVLPTLESACPGFSQALVERADQARREQADRRAEILSWWQPQDNRLPLAPALVDAAPPLRWTLWRQLLQHLQLPHDRRHLHRLDDLVAGRPGRALHLRQVLLRRERGALVWCRLAQPVS